MHPKGHLGISLVVYAPIALFLGMNGFYLFAVLGFFMMGAFATIPDNDQRIPVIKHRGLSHSIASALLFGVVLGFVAIFFVPLFAMIGIPAGPVVGFAAFIGMFVFLTHLIGDSITPTGIKPFAPISDYKITFGIVKADNTIANLVLWVAGWVMMILVFLLILGTLF